jgi:hypothetical protein
VLKFNSRQSLPCQLQQHEQQQQQQQK